MKCRECEGSRHRWDGEKWAPCPCLDAARRARAYANAKIPPKHLRETWRTFLDRWGAHPQKIVASLIAACASLAKGDFAEGWFLLEGDPVGRRLVSSLVLVAACDGGFVPLSLDVPRLIDAEFEAGRGERERASPVLVLEVGGEPRVKNSWNAHVVEKVLKERWDRGLFTLFSSDVEAAALAEEYERSEIAARAVEEKFGVVELRRRK